MNKAQLAKAVAKTLLSQTSRNVSGVLVGQIIDLALATIATTVQQDEKVNLRGFGAFRLRQRHERQGRNPRNGNAVVIAAQKTLVFKAAKPPKAKAQKAG